MEVKFQILGNASILLASNARHNYDYIKFIH